MHLDDGINAPGSRARAHADMQAHAGDMFGAAVAILLHRDLHADTVYVGAPSAGEEEEGAVYVFRRGQDSYEALCGLGRGGVDSLDGSPGGGRDDGDRDYTERTWMGTGAGGGWGLIEILHDPQRRARNHLGFSLAVAPSALPPPSPSSTSSLLVVGTPGWRQAQAEHQVALPAGSALVFRRGEASVAGDVGSWAFEERLLVSGELLGSSDSELGTSIAILRPDTVTEWADETARGGKGARDVVVLGAPGLGEGASGGLFVFASDGIGRAGGQGEVRHLWKRIKTIVFDSFSTSAFSSFGVAIAAVGDDSVIVGGPTATNFPHASHLLSDAVPSGAARVLQLRRSVGRDGGGRVWKPGHFAVVNSEKAQGSGGKSEQGLASGSSCWELLQRGYNTSGLYWLQTSAGHGRAARTSQEMEEEASIGGIKGGRADAEVPHDSILGYCEMRAMGGGWLMCYTSQGEVDVVNEFRFDARLPYGLHG